MTKIDLYLIGHGKKIEEGYFQNYQRVHVNFYCKDRDVLSLEKLSEVVSEVQSVVSKVPPLELIYPDNACPNYEIDFNDSGKILTGMIVKVAGYNAVSYIPRTKKNEEIVKYYSTSFPGAKFKKADQFPDSLEKCILWLQNRLKEHGIGQMQELVWLNVHWLACRADPSSCRFAGGKSQLIKFITNLGGAFKKSPSFVMAAVEKFANELRSSHTSPSGKTLHGFLTAACSDFDNQVLLDNKDKIEVYVNILWKNRKFPEETSAYMDDMVKVAQARKLMIWASSNALKYRQCRYQGNYLESPRKKDASDLEEDTQLKSRRLN